MRVVAALLVACLAASALAQDAAKAAAPAKPAPPAAPAATPKADPAVAPKAAAPATPAAKPSAPVAAGAPSQQSSGPAEPRWAAMTAKIAGMAGICNKLTQKWQCNSGSQICTWDEAQKPPCVVPESFVRSKLISSVPCPGSLMEGWFACTAANNNKGACLAKKAACTWTDWGNYTSLPLPTRRRMLVDAGEGEPGACQLTEVFLRRKGEEWDALSTLAFQISHLDKTVWGDCSTVKQLNTLVPPASRQPCAAARTKAACVVAAPLCAWQVRKPGDAASDALSRHWPEGDCATTCNTTDRPTCDKYGDECLWAAAAGACAVNDGSASRDAGPAGNATAAGAPASPKAACADQGRGDARVACAAESAIDDAAFTLIQISKEAASKEEAPAAANATEAPAAPKNGAAAGRVGGALAGLAALAAAALLL